MQKQLCPSNVRLLDGKYEAALPSWPEATTDSSDVDITIRSIAVQLAYTKRGKNYYSQIVITVVSDDCFGTVSD